MTNYNTGQSITNTHTLKNIFQRLNKWKVTENMTDFDVENEMPKSLTEEQKWSLIVSVEQVLVDWKK